MITLWLYLKMSLIAGSYTKVFGSQKASCQQIINISWGKKNLRSEFATFL